MAVYKNSQVVLGFEQPLLVGAPVPIISQRVPTANDKAEIGTLWIDTLTNSVYTLTSIVANVAVWTNTAGGGEIVASITATTGPNSLTGTTGINTAGAAITTIGTGGTGAVRIGNATGNTAVTGGLATTTTLAAGTTVTGGTGVIATTGNVSASAGAVNAFTTMTAGTGITATTGNITASTGNIIATLGSISAAAGNITATAGSITAGTNLILSAAGGTVTFAPGPVILAGAGAPAGVHPKGSLYLRTDGTGVNDRAYIATDGAGTWTAIVTVA